MQRITIVPGRKTSRPHKPPQVFARRAFPGPLSQACEAYDPDYAVTVRDRPRSKSAESRSFQGFLDGRVDLKNFRGFAHRVLPAAAFPAAGTPPLAGECRLDKRSEERRVGKECRSRWSPYH